MSKGTDFLTKDKEEIDLTEEDDFLNIDPSSVKTSNKDDYDDDDNVDNGEKNKGAVKDDEKTKKENTPAKQLRQLKDKAEKEVERLKQQVSDLSKLNTLRKVYDYIKEKTGKDPSEQDVDEFIERQRARKKVLKEKEDALKEKDLKLKEVNIQFSDEYHNGFIKPIEKARDTLFATIVNPDPNGNVRNKELYAELAKELVSVDENGKPNDSIKIKGIIKRFSTEFKEKTGEEYEFPPLRDVISSISEIHEKILSANKAKSDWEGFLEERKKEKIYDEAQKQKALKAKELDGRNYIFNTFIEEFSDDNISNIFTKDEIKDATSGYHQRMTDVLLQKEGVSPHTYNEFLEIVSKSGLFDKLLSKYNDAVEEIKKYKKKIGETTKRHNGYGHSRSSMDSEVSMEEDRFLD